MTGYMKAFVAIGAGLQLCFTKPAIRRLATVPWGIGTVCYLASAYAAIKTHPILLDWAVGTPDGIWKTLLYFGAYVLFALLLLIGTMLISISIVLIATSVLQSEIAKRVLLEQGVSLPTDGEGVRAILKDTGRTALVETGKLLWLLPLIVCTMILGLIPIFTPFALILGAWLLAFQFVDIILDLYRLSAWERFRFSLRHGALLVCFGFSLSLCWAVPFLGIFLPPAAVAAAAWLFSSTELIQRLESSLGVEKPPTK